MKKHNKYFIVLIIIMLVIISSSDLMACAMCKETGDGSTGFSNRGINSGILYLMIIPYIAFSVLAYFWYKASKKQKAHDQKIANVLKSKID